MGILAPVQGVSVVSREYFDCLNRSQPAPAHGADGGLELLQALHRGLRAHVGVRGGRVARVGGRGLRRRRAARLERLEGALLGLQHLENNRNLQCAAISLHE